MESPHIWLRAETKPQEQRTALTPHHAKALLEAGFTVTIERSAQNIFDDSLYQEAGCRLVDAGSWPQAPAEAFVLGLKELPQGQDPLCHRHIYFAHAYKEQAGWQQLLGRFHQGEGVLYDLEFLVDEQQRRIAAFGHWAGFAGAALAVKTWAGQQLGQTPSLPPVTSCRDQGQLMDQISILLEQLPRRPQVLVIGAKGRSGQGAVAVARTLGLEVIEWDLEETRRGGPFRELNAVDIVVNCVLVNRALPPFMTRDSLASDDRRLSVIADVSCDPYGDYNPLPVYEACTHFDAPTLRLIKGNNPLDLIAIDHLPSLLPKESSEDFCRQLLPHLLQLATPERGVWAGAKTLFEQKIQLIKG